MAYVHLQVGESDQKLAEGISIYSIATDMRGKASILGPLITVRVMILEFVWFFPSWQIYLFYFLFNFSFGPISNTL